MISESLLILFPAVLVVALLYSIVGHAGASGYIAVMALVGISPAAIKPTALILNIVVASIGSFQFWNAGHFSWRLFWPFALFSIPSAFLGGYISLPTRGFSIVFGLVLLFSVVRFFIRPREGAELRMPGVAKALPVGAGLSLLAGLTGTGGGISTDQVNYNGNHPWTGCVAGQYRSATTAVGSFVANPWGLYDMAGNVAEWTWDVCGVYNSNAVTNPKGPDSGSRRRYRGGGWGGSADLLRSAHRTAYLPTGAHSNGGSRSAVSQP